jgi:hypothetical protein
MSVSRLRLISSTLQGEQHYFKYNFASLKVKAIVLNAYGDSGNHSFTLCVVL